MRRVVSCLAFGGLLALAGCNNTRLGVINRGPSVPPQASTQVPTVKALVDYMDNNAQLVQGLASDDVTLSVHQGLKPIPNLRARLACQRPRNFRLTAELLSSTEVDIGSNQQEFWFWLKRAEPPAQYFCTYQDLSAGRVRVLPFPFQPEWVAETLGVGNYGPAERYQLQVESARFKLVERVNGPQGKTLRKVIVFNRYKAEGNQPQITDYQLFDDASGQEICSARITEVQGSEAQGIVPRRLELRWPAEKLRLGLRLNKVALNPQTPPTLFVRQRMPGVQSIDLATGRPEPQLNALQQAGGRR